MEQIQNFNLLIVDDSLLSLNHLKKILLKVGYNVEGVSSGKEALEFVKQNPPDLILLDIMMPEMDGFEVIQFLKADKKSYNIPVIFLTGNDDHQSKITAFDLGAVDYIVKPFHPQEVKARVKVHLKLSIATKTVIESQKAKLEQIKEAQESILINPDEMPEAKFSVIHRHMLEAGGDFYDVLKMSDDLFIYFIADVSGHDIATSYVTPAVKALLKQNCSPIYTPEETLSMMNQVLSETLPGDKYLSAFYVILNRKTNKITFVNAGHPPGFVIPVEGEIAELDTEGDLIGMFDDAYYSSNEISVSKGDKILLYTDGLVESADMSGAVWSAEYEKVIPFLEKHRNLPIEMFPEIIFKEMIPDTSLLDDDVIVLVFEV